MGKQKCNIFVAVSVCLNIKLLRELFLFYEKFLIISCDQRRERGVCMFKRNLMSAIKACVPAVAVITPECYCYFIMSGDRRCNLAKS